MTSKVKIRKIRISKEVEVLSPLEKAVLSQLWKAKSARVRDVHAKLKGKKIALTSVAVILDRLHKKGLVKRTMSKGRGGVHYTYSPVVTEQGFQQSVLDATVERLIDSFGKVAVNYFNERFAKEKRR